MKTKLVVASTNPHLSQDEMEDHLIKAIASSKQRKNDKKELRDLYLKSHKDRTASAVHLVFQSMLSEVENVLTKG